MTWVFVPRLDPFTNDYNVDRYTSSTGHFVARPGIHANKGTDYIVLTDHIHQWLVDRGQNYHVHNSTTSGIDYHHENEGLDVWIDDPRIAMLFKLTFSGAKKVAGR